MTTTLRTTAPGCGRRRSFSSRAGPARPASARSPLLGQAGWIEYCPRAISWTRSPQGHALHERLDQVGRLPADQVRPSSSPVPELAHELAQTHVVSMAHPHATSPKLDLDWPSRGPCVRPGPAQHARHSPPRDPLRDTAAGTKRWSVLCWSSGWTTLWSDPGLGSPRA
ncbi:hypothetical protein QJS66_05750 [Kocuria rhizophila]|nr:hypothetical protein QJS66_05750 [Kocuria rhizophila]